MTDEVQMGLKDGLTVAEHQQEPLRRHEGSVHSLRTPGTHQQQHSLSHIPELAEGHLKVDHMKAAESALWLKDGIALAEHQCEPLRKHEGSVHSLRTPGACQQQHSLSHIPELAEGHLKVDHMKAAESALWLKDGIALAEHQCEPLRKHEGSVHSLRTPGACQQQHSLPHIPELAEGQLGV